jgi:RNA polymerase sigma-70 factor (ECF subfamily)
MYNRVAQHMSDSKAPDAIGLPFPATLPQDARADTAVVTRQVLSLLDECGPGLRRYVGSFRLGSAATEDVIQDVFLALFRHLSNGRPATNLKGWLYQVAHNLALKQRQRAARRWLFEGTWDGVTADLVPDESLNPEERFTHRERQRRLIDTLQRLPERDQQCLLLRAEGLSYRDISKTLGVSLGSVAKSMVRAITRLAAADRE